MVSRNSKDPGRAMSMQLPHDSSPVRPEEHPASYYKALPGPPFPEYA
jgi:hypothetical protein